MTLVVAVKNLVEIKRYGKNKKSGELCRDKRNYYG